MGSTGALARADEAPPHRVRVDGFWMDVHEVTNAEFRAFVAATAYVTTAERAPTWEELEKDLPPGTPKPPDEVLVPGSMVFTPPDGPVPLNNYAAWWSWVPGASWRHPEGPGSTIDGRDDHPVVQVSYDDAVAYAKWAGKRLPTEAEWERAARGGIENGTFTWGDDPITPKRANTWQGAFPHRNEATDGHATTAPVGTFPPNAYGLHDMAGNVWEWCSDWYRPDTYAQRAGGAVDVNPAGPDDSYDPAEPGPWKRVQRGGSFLCHVSYCASYRPAARMKTTPDSGLAHCGFRCVREGADADADAGS
jgi:formylglycine-generating enzyme required for sulfatase activity